MKMYPLACTVCICGVEQDSAALSVHMHISQMSILFIIANIGQKVILVIFRNGRCLSSFILVMLDLMPICFD